MTDIVIGPSYEPKNVYLVEEFVPGDMKRVALLPISSFQDNSSMDSGRMTLEPVFQAEFAKANVFELIAVQPGQLRRWTGQSTWTGEEALPSEFLESLWKATGCDAVMFIQLTEFQAYPPVRIGWRCKLIDTLSGQIWWAADEVFDGGNPLVVNGARRYYQQQMQQPAPLMDSRSILNSPRRFGHYTVSALAATLPRR